MSETVLQVIVTGLIFVLCAIMAAHNRKKYPAQAVGPVSPKNAPRPLNEPTIEESKPIVGEWDYNTPKKKQKIELEVVTENGKVKSFDFVDRKTGIQKSYKLTADIPRNYITEKTENLYRNRFIDYLENYEEIKKQERIKNFGLKKDVTVLHSDSMLSRIGAGSASKLNAPVNIDLLTS